MSDGTGGERPVAALMVGRDGETRASRVVALDQDGEWVLGRGAGCDVPIEDRAVSRRHLLVRRVDGAVFVEDLGSRNGTFVVDESGRVRRLPPRAPTPLRHGQIVRLGGSVLIPCRPAGEEVLLTAHAPFSDDASTIDDEVLALADVEARAAAMEAIERALDPGAGDAWSAVLRGLSRLVAAEAAFLFVPRGQRFVLKASAGGSGPACVSERFLERTSERARAWRLAPGEPSSEDSLSPSLAGYDRSVELVGVPFLDRNDEIVAVGYLEVRDGPTTGSGLAAVDLYARAVGPWLAAYRLADRETRRRRALEARLAGDAGVPAPGHGRASAELVAESRAFRECVRTVRRASSSDSTILLRGPSGAGKEALALLAHEASPRRDQPFEAINCASLPEPLIESELFGYDRGAFTGAEQDRPGLFERADGGTLFLDEVGDLGTAAQAKILRVIDTGEVVRVGGSRHQVDVRILAATNRDLEAMVAQGRFRSDLYYRLRVIEVVIPPLRDRPEDILPLARLFLSRLRAPGAEPAEGITETAARALARYPWPGNARELRNVIERAVVLDSDGVIDLDDLPPDIAGIEPRRDGDDGGLADGLEQLPWPEARREFERRFFLRAFERHGRVGQRTARALGVSRRTVYEKLRRYTGSEKRSRAGGAAGRDMRPSGSAGEAE